MFIHDRLGRRKDATGAIVDFIRVASSSGFGSTHLIGHELGHNLMSIARDAGVITEAQQKELDALFTDKNGKFDEEAFAEAFARELKRAFFETVQKRMEDVPATKAGRALRRVADFIATLARSFAFWRQERGLDPVTGQPLQAGQVLDAFLKRERTAVDEATRIANAARAAEARATQEAMANAPTQTVVDEDGTEVAYHERGGRDVSAEDFARTFGIRLAMDGNARSQDTANVCYDTLLKLAKLMGVPQETLGIGGLLTLDIAVVEELLNPVFYPTNNTINLTIPNNINVPEIATAATIVHEWTHALDRIVGLGRDADPNVEITEETTGALSHGIGPQVREELLQAGKRMTEALRNTRFYERISNDEEIKELDREDPEAQLFDPQEVFARALANYYLANELGRIPMFDEGLGPTMEELSEVGPILREFFDALEVGVNETTGVQTLYHTADMGFGSGMLSTQYNEGVSNVTAMLALRLVAGHPISVSPDTLNRSVAILTGTFSPYDNQGRKIRFNPNGTRAKGGSGLLHLVDERVANDYAELYLSGDRDGAIKKAVTDLLRVIEAVQHGHIVEVRGNRNTPNQVILEHKNEADGETYRAVVSWDRKENGFTLTTGYRVDPKFAKTQVDVNTGESSVVLRRSEFLTSEYYGHLKRKLPELTRQIVAELFPDLQGENKADPNEERRDHIHVWSGAPQAYDRVDFAYIGSGTGGNNEGRGAYSSGVRGVAQDKYARGALRWWEPYIQTGRIIFDGKVFDNARRFFNSLGDSLAGTFYTGEGLKRTADGNYLADGVAYSEDVVLLYAIARGLGYSAFRSEEFYEFILFQGRSETNLKDDRIHKKTLEYANDIYDTLDDYKNPEDREMAKFFADLVKTKLAKKKDWIAFWDSILKKAEPELVRTEDPPPAVMEQTWFTNRPEGDVSHLLNWFEAVTPEQMGWILDGARKAGFSEEEIAFLQRERIDDDDVLIEDGNRMPSGREMYMRLELIKSVRDGIIDLAEERYDNTQGWILRLAHQGVMGDVGKFASEFFVSADIDGMMYPVDYRHGNRDGRVSGWNYVAFSDEHLRVDHVYEYNPETDDFEKKWHEGGGSVPRFTETPLGQELVAEAFDAIMGSRVDLLLRPSRYYGNPYETRDRNPRNALVTEHLHRDVDVSEPRGFATEVSAEISRFGTREGDPTLRDIRARCGSKERFYEVLGAVYETAEAIRSGLSEVVTGRERTMMSNAGLLAAEFIKHNATARATALGRKLYLMGREFAWKLYKEDIAAARAEAQAKVQEANAKTREAKAQTRNAERREETARNQAYQNRWGLAEERFMREYERALLRHQAARKVSDVREKMQEQVDLLRLREAKKRALERERGVTFTALKATLGVDIPARLRALAGTQEDPFEAAAKLIAEIDDGFDKWVKRDRRDLLDGTEPYTYLNEQGERAYAETMGNVLKAVARDLSYGKLREALVNAADKIARSKPETVRVIVEGKLGRVARVLRLAQNADIVTLANRRIKSALAEANKRLSSANSGMRTRYMTAMRKQAKELIKTMQLAVSAQDNTKASEKKKQAMLAERARLAEELKVIESGKSPDDLAKDETLTDRQHKDAVKLMFLEKFGDLSFTIDPAEVWAKAAEAEAFVVS